MAHTNSGMRIQARPFARIVCTVTMKLRPVTMVEKPTMNTPSKASGTAVGVDEL